MKKRKAPVLLVSILVVLLGGAVMFGMKTNGPAKGAVDEPTTQEHESPTAAELKGSVSASAKKKAWQAQQLMVAGGDKPGPSIAVDPSQNRLPKPTFNPSERTGSGWYDNH